MFAAMPWTASYSEHGADVRFFGIVNGSEILEAKARLFAHRFSDGAVFSVCDFTDANDFRVSTPELESIIQQDATAVRMYPGIIEAVIAPTPLQFGLARMWQTRVDAAGPHTGVFRTRPDALHWLQEHGVELPAATVAERGHGAAPDPGAPGIP